MSHTVFWRDLALAADGHEGLLLRKNNMSDVSKNQPPEGQPNAIPIAAESFPVSDQFADFLFSEITEKPNSLFRVFSETKIIKFYDLEQLREKLFQEFRVTTIVSSSFEAEIAFADKQRANVNDFDLFKTFDTSRPVAVREVILRFRFLIRHANSKKHEPYQIEFGARNRIPYIEKLFFMDIDGFDNKPASMRTKIDHVDYMIAKNLMNTIADWIDNLEESPRDYYYEFLVKRSHTINLLVSTLVSLSSLFVGWWISTRFIGPLESEGLLLSLMIVFSIYVIFRQIGSWFGASIERNLDRTGVGSYVAITQGDERAIENIRKRNKSFVYRAVKGGVSAAAVVALNILSAYIFAFFIR